MSYEQGFAITADVILTVYLLWVAIQDFHEMQVVRYSHGLGLLAVLILVILNRGNIAEYPVEYILGLIFVLMTQVIAGKCHLYGMADILVFFVCGLFFLMRKGPALYLTAYMMLHAMSGGLLLMVQLLKRNVKGVRLCKPVAYIPYISFAFVLTNVVV
jgi:Flp pilus assembly protein protease CpaA